jgi:hypothetical protein
MCNENINFSERYTRLLLNKTMCFPLPLIEEIEKAIQNKDVTFSSFVIQACEYALRDMDE